ncbi:hypothetical protein BG004_008232 [Podila humilis]|nr:hypothetical protein BG004_008232 [Podila humilis]
MSRLPAFLRFDASSRATVEAQYALFAQLNLLEQQRAQAALNAASPLSVLHAVQDSTRELNRYSDILPYRHSQVTTGSPSTTQITHDNYINANRISVPAQLQSSLPENWRGYIATQAPLPDTQGRFWQMILEQNVHVIVCLTAVRDDRTRRAKAERYWPLAGETDIFERNNVHVKSLDKENQPINRIVAYRHFEIWNPASSEPRRSVLQVHYQGWPDHGVPGNTKDLGDMLAQIRTWKQDQEQKLGGHIDFGPAVVHCSAGCGRTGTFCVVDTSLSVLEHTGYPYLKRARAGTGVAASPVHMESEARTPQDQYHWTSSRDIIFEALNSFRQDRMLMVQTAPQYSFCYHVVRDLCE